MIHYSKLTPPASGDRITVSNGHSASPITRSSALSKATAPDRISGMRQKSDRCGDCKSVRRKKKIEWFEVYAGEKANVIYGENTWLHDDTLEAIKEYVVRSKVL